MCGTDLRRSPPLEISSIGHWANRRKGSFVIRSLFQARLSKICQQQWKKTWNPEKCDGSPDFHHFSTWNENIKRIKETLITWVTNKIYCKRHLHMYSVHIAVLKAWFLKYGNDFCKATIQYFCLKRWLVIKVVTCQLNVGDTESVPKAWSQASPKGCQL